MALDMSHPTTTGEPYRLPLSAVRWNAIFAGLAVGIGTNVFLLLLGAAAGLAVFDAGAADGAMTAAAAIWNTVCMVVAAFTGGYVAARTAGLRRAADGILHGVVAWGATMVISAFLVTSIAGVTLGTLFATAPPAERAASAEIIGSLDEGNRQEAISVLRDRLGLSIEQANSLVDQALVLSGREELVSPQGRAAAEKTLRTASAASGWLSAAILLSLVAAMGGGLLGARGTRREVRQHTGGPTTTTPGAETPAAEVPPASRLPPF